MKIWIDVLTPKQVNFFAPLSRRLQRKGHRVTLTTRVYREANQMLAALRIDATKIGQHGGADLRQKLTSSTKRIEKLIPFVNKIAPNICISFSSPEAARVSFGLGVPHLCISDSPHAEAVSRLTVPLSRKLFTPSVIPKEAWTRYGISRGNIVHYDALDPVVWLRDFSPDRKILERLGLEESRPIVILRSAESRAAYLSNIATTPDLMVSLSKALIRRLPNLQIVLLSRYDLSGFLKKHVPATVTVPSTIVDSSSLLSYADVFVGGGGTMTAEAALLGVPTISCYPSEPTYVDKFLIRRGLLERRTALETIVSRSVHLLSKGKGRERKTRAQTLLDGMEDPLAYIEGEVARFV
ncbi:MAG: DUF354 domain-containing protein [archaeon]